MPQAAVIDDKYGLEQAPVPTGVTDDKYGLEPAQKQSDSGVEPNLPGATPRLVAAAKTNPKVAEMIKPSRFEESNPAIPKNYGFTAGNLAGNAWRGLKELGGAAYDTGKDLLFSEGKNAAGEEEHGIGGLVGMNAEGEFDPLGRASHLAHKYILDPGKAQADKAKQDIATGNVGAAVGHTIASAVPVAGPWAADLAEQAGSGDIGGTIARGGTQVLAGEAVKPLSKVVARTAGDVRERVGGAIHDPETGEMTKGAEGLSRATGAVVGGVTGAGIGSIGGPAGTYAGGGIGVSAGGLAGPALMERAFPEPAPRVAAREQFAKDKMITEAQEGADKEDAARQKQIEKQNKGVIDTIQLPPQPKIIQPGGEPNEGRPATWTDDVTQMLAPLGDPDAMAQIRNRMKGVNPLNPGRIPLSYSTVETTPKSRTSFTAEGQPIEQPVTPRGDQEPIGGIPVLNPPIAKPTSSVRTTPRIVDAVKKQGEIPKVAAGGSSAPLNFDRSIKVPSEGPVLLKPEAPAPEQATPAPKEGYQGPERRSEPRTDTGERSWGFYKRMLREGGPEEQALAREALKRMETTAPAGVAPMEKPTNLLPGMAEHVEKQAEGAARVKGEDLTAQIRQPRDINAAAGEMETKSPLFRGTDASPQRELLQPMEKPVETAPEREPGDEPEEEATPTEIKGVTQPVKAKAAPKPKPLPIEKRFSKEQIDDAEGLIKQEIGMLQSADRPGIYYDQNEIGDFNPQKIQSSARGVTSGGNWRGLKSGREMQPWLKGTKFTPAQLEKALRNKDSAVYQRAMESAMEFIRRQNMTPEERAMAAAAEAEKWKNLVPPKSKFADLSKK